MAEFTEIIKIKKRMCTTIKYCDKCPLSSYNNKHTTPCGTFFSTDPEEYERICLDWAKENLEISNRDKLYQIIEEAFGVDVAKKFEIHVNCDYFECPIGKTCATCKYRGFWGEPYVKPMEDK